MGETVPASATQRPEMGFSAQKQRQAALARDPPRGTCERMIPAMDPQGVGRLLLKSGRELRLVTGPVEILGGRGKEVVVITAEKGDIPGDLNTKFTIKIGGARAGRTKKHAQIHPASDQMPNERALILNGMSEDVG